jgi:protein gp37
MAKTAIEWTDKVWNPVTGCTKVSQGCKNCYAETIAGRFWAKQYPKNEDGSDRTFTDVRLHPERLEQPLSWKKPQKVFVNSMSDLFHKDVSFWFILQAFEVMVNAKQHTFQVLTKRPDRMLEFFKWLDEPQNEPAGATFITGWPVPNVWLGVSVEDSKNKVRIDALRKTPAAVRFLSLEPLLEDLGELDLTGIHWVICGGESGPNARPMHPEWVRSIRDQCVSAEVPFFFKQWGQWKPLDGSAGKTETLGHGSIRIVFDGPGKTQLDKGWIHALGCGKKAAGKLLDGREWSEFPKV